MVLATARCVAQSGVMVCGLANKVSSCNQYNAHMGVDHLDQMRSYNSVGRAGRRWWKYLLWGLLNVGIINAYVNWIDNIVIGHPLVKFGGRKRICRLCSRHTRRMHRGGPVESSFGYTTCKCIYAEKKDAFAHTMHSETAGIVVRR